MNDLTIAPGPGIPGGLVIVAADLTERFAKSSGPGGQGVNTTDSKVQLSVDIATCSSLSDAQRRRVLHNHEHRLDGTVLTVTASTQRLQVRNRAEARDGGPKFPSSNHPHAYPHADGPGSGNRYAETAWTG